MNRVFIFHCWEGTPDYCWYPWLKRELEKKDIQVQVPALPNTEHPNRQTWVEKIQEIIGQPDEKTVLVGHSIGCVAIMRYLEGLEPEQQIGGVVFVAGYTDNLGFDELKSFFETPLDYEKMMLVCPRFVTIHSDNDPYVDLKYSAELSEKLRAKTIIKAGMGHFSGAIEGEKSCQEIPEVLQEVLTMYSL